MTTEDPLLSSFDDAIKTDRSESALARNVARGLGHEGWAIYTEVPLRTWLPDAPTGIADIVAVSHGLAMVVEVKRSFSLTLIEQAAEWTRFVPLVVMALPGSAHSTRHALRDHLCQHFGLGLCRDAGNGNIVWDRRPKLLRHHLRNVARIQDSLTDPMQAAEAGERWAYRETPYQRMMTEVRILIAECGPVPVKVLIEALDRPGKNPYSSRTYLARNLVHGIRAYEPDLAIGADSRVIWTPTQCAKGDKYIGIVMATAARRVSIAHPLL
ncbi:hypothetical protein [Azospirillum canadense]|uniref:hypothetical protein n=1 Tax=Azospirillum canadense TaxID=403962 RepID=UPI002227F732|nr:hypothetical protein [Azospirillum canadense]MCW2240724.1 hypothetical protein [Azospirillum canadense]